MSPEILGSFDSIAAAEKAQQKVRSEGFRASDMAVITSAADMDTTLRPESDFPLSIKRGVIGGAIVGFIFGLGFVFLSGSPEFIHWGGMLSIPIAESAGWALFGMILGASGILAVTTVSSQLEERLEKELTRGRVLLAIRLHQEKEIDKIAAILYQAGAADVSSAA